MANNLERLSGKINCIGNYSFASGTRTNTSLNAAYVHNTSGNAVAVRYMAMTTDTIDELYIFLDTITGTRGNITMEAKIYNENSSNASRAGLTERDSSVTGVTMPASDDMWIKFTFDTPYTPAIGEILWIVAYNTAAAPATDFPQILTATTAVMGGIASGIGNMLGYSTTNGWTTNGSSQAKMPFVIKQGSNYFGQPYTQRASAPYTSNQLERGIVITPTEDMVVVGALIDSSTSFNLLRILADATAPGGTALYEYDLDSDTNQLSADVCGAKLFSSPVTLSGGTTYKVTLTFSANATIPGAHQIEDYSSYSAMFDTMRGYDSVFMPYSVIDNGAGGWTSNKALSPTIQLIVQDFPAISSSGTTIAGTPMMRGMI